MAKYDEFGGEIVEAEGPEVDEFGGEIVKAEAPAPVPVPAFAPAPKPPEPSFGEKLARKGLAAATGIVEAVPLGAQAVAGLRSLVGPETFEQELAGVREEQRMVEEGEPWMTGLSKFGMTAAQLPIVAGKALSLPAQAARFGAFGAAQAAGQEGATAGDIALAGLESAAVPALFKGAAGAARGLAPKPETTALGAGLRRAGQALLKGTPVAAMTAAPISTLRDPNATEAAKVEAGANLALLLGLPVAQTYKGAKRIGAERAASVAEQAEMEGRRVIEEGQAARGEKAVAQVRKGEEAAERARGKTATTAIEEQRRQEAEAYEADVAREVGREMQTAKASTEEAGLIRRRQAEEATRQERDTQRAALEQQVEQVQDEVRLERRKAEDQALTDAQLRNDVAVEQKLWNDKNRRAQRAVKDEQRIISAAERLRRGDEATVADLQAELAELKAAEDALTTGEDPSLRGAIAKKYQDMRHRLETALKMFQDDGIEPPEAYRQAYDSVRESYLRNTAEQGYVGFGSGNEQFLEDPRAWAEGERVRRLNKVQADRTGKEAAIVRFLEGMAQRDYMAESRATRTGPQVPETRIRELFADQGLEYTGGPLVRQDGTPIPQAFVGGRVPDPKFTPPETMAQSIARRRALQDEIDKRAALVRSLKRSQPRVATARERQDVARLADIQARQAAGFSGLTPRQEFEQAVRARMPAPAGLSEADILSRVGISPTPATPFPEADILQAAGITPAEAARLFAEQRAAARNRVAFGTTTPTALTQRDINPESTGRALWETVVPEWLQGGVRLVSSLGARATGSNVAPRSLPEFTRRTSPTLSTESRMSTPFEALELASAFQKALETDNAFAQGFRRFLNNNIGGTWFGYLQSDAQARAKVEAERAAAAGTP